MWLERMMLARLVPVYSRLELVLDELREGQLDPKVAHAMAKVLHQVPSSRWLP